MSSEGNNTSSWDWPLKSALASIVSMLFVWVALALPLRWALIPIIGFLIFLFFLIHNPVGRYLRLSISVLGIWAAIIFHSAIDVGFTSSNLGSAWLSVGKIDWYVHVLCAVLASFLFYLALGRHQKLGENIIDTH